MWMQILAYWSLFFTWGKFPFKYSSVAIIGCDQWTIYDSPGFQGRARCTQDRSGDEHNCFYEPMKFYYDLHGIESLRKGCHSNLLMEMKSLPEIGVTLTLKK